MGKLTYSLNVSLGGFVETIDHGLEWTTVDDELHSWFNEQTRGLDASLYGRRLHELMAGHWPTAKADPAATEPMRGFARIWRAAPKVVFSTTPGSVAWNSRLFAGDVVERLAELRSEFHGDIDVGGPNLASQFIERGLMDESGSSCIPSFSARAHRSSPRSAIPSACGSRRRGRSRPASSTFGTAQAPDGGTESTGAGAPGERRGVAATSVGPPAPGSSGRCPTASRRSGSPPGCRAENRPEGRT